jgi:hypothetical protein
VSWHVVQISVIPASALCFACLPATSGYTLPTGGLAWQEVQFASVKGDPAWWHVVQSGAEESGEVPVTAWQVEQFPSNPACVTWVWAGSR